MSSADLLSRNDLRLVRSELRLVLTRRRNIAMLVVLALAPTLIGVAIKLSGPGDGEGPSFLASITENGLFLVFTALVATLPVFLPLAVSVVSGESVAGEASTGTLRYLLAAPVHRTRLLAVKLVAIVVYALVATLTVAAVGLIVGGVLFGLGDLTLLSGTTIGVGPALVRALLVALYVAAMLTTVAALGLFVSTLTEVPLAAMSATAITVVVVEILDAVPQLSAVHDWLFTHDWLAFGELLRDPVSVGPLLHGLAVQAGYVAVFSALAWARMATKDVTS
ncbi:MAG TPA: ABC transporter permease [Actinomycetales bacterium]|nr:ABC transporter permease [Actinomycetales bacterium]